MKKIIDLLAVTAITLIMASGCQDTETQYGGERLRTVYASFEGNATRVSLAQDEDPESRNMITRWQTDDRIHIILWNKKGYVDIGTVPIHYISENAKSCDYQYALPDGFDASNGYRLACFTNNCKPEIKDGEVYYNASLVRMPISQFKARVMFNQFVQDENYFASFLHYGAYELLHINNKSDKSITFSLYGYDADQSWYKNAGCIRLLDNKFIADASYEMTEKSPSITIPANSSDIIVSWYIPNGMTIQNAKIVAEIDGNFVHSSNAKSSDVTICEGIAYHLYATWDGKELKYDKGPNDIDYVQGICSDPDPEDGATIEGTGVYLSCNSEYGLSYQVNLSDTPDMSNVVKRVRISNSVYAVSFYDLKPNTKYYWRVLYYDENEWDYVNCSPIWSFTTGSE